MGEFFAHYTLVAAVANDQSAVWTSRTPMPDKEVPHVGQLSPEP